jgi:hypothetical protein
MPNTSIYIYIPLTSVANNEPLGNYCCFRFTALELSVSLSVANAIGKNPFLAPI